MKDTDRLMQRFNEKQVELDQDRADKERRKKNRREYTAFLKLPEHTETEFFCDWCVQDFTAPAYKTWSEHYGVGAWISFCPICGRPMCRWITDKKNDPYYAKSARVRSMRSEFMADTLQPQQYGFRTLYGDPFEKYQKLFQQQDIEIRSRYLSMGLSGETLKEKTEREKIKQYFEA